MKTDFSKMTKDFILNEGTSPSVISYIQSLYEILESMSPKSVSDFRRMEVAKENILNIRRHFKRMQEKITTLEEEIKIFQENKKE